MNLSEATQTLNDLRAINKETTAMISQQFDFVKGLSFGLAYGIVGNLFVQVFYGFIEKGLLGLFDAMFYIDLVLLILSSVAIVITSLKLRKQIRKFRTYRKYAGSLEKEIDEFEEMIKATEKLVNAKRPQAKP